MDDRLRWIVVITVLAVWVANFTAGVVSDSYEPRESINGIFMGIVGGALALPSRRKGGNGGGKSDE